MGNVNHLNTEHFDSTVTAYEGYIKQFEELVKEVNSICAEVVQNWKGKGSDAFEKDYRQVQLNLKDITDIMYEIRDALTNANSEYLKTDDTMAKKLTS